MSSLSKPDTSTNSSKKTRVGGDDSAADLESLLPHESEPIEPGNNHDESDLELAKTDRAPEVATKDARLTSSNSSPSAAATGTSGNRLSGTMGLDDLNGGIKYEGRNGDVWARNAALVRCGFGSERLVTGIYHVSLSDFRLVLW